MRPTRTLTAPLATALAAAMLAAPAGAQIDPPSAPSRPTHPQTLAHENQDSARAQDLRRLEAGGETQDLRSADARDAAAGRSTGAAAAPTGPDLRSADARDAAEGRSTADVAAPIVEVTRAAGFDWGDAAIGAGGATGLLAISLAGAMTLRRRQTRPRSWTAAG